MSTFITQIMLPISLAFMMLSIGLSTRVSDFIAIKGQKKAVVAGFLLQIVALPLLALLLILLFDIRGDYAVALLLVAACPGGVTSNAITYIFSGAVALSIVLTLLSSAIAPFSVPLITQWSLAHFLASDSTVQFSLVKTTLKLFALSIVPLLVGQIVQRLAPVWCAEKQALLRKLSGWWFLGLIVAMTLTHFPLLLTVVKEMGWLMLLLSIFSLQLGYWGARLLKLAYPLRLTLAVEVGVQNAGVGLFISATILNNQAMAMMLIAYGILMQIPVFTFAWLYRKRIARLQAKAISGT